MTVVDDAGSHITTLYVDGSKVTNTSRSDCRLAFCAMIADPIGPKKNNNALEPTHVVVYGLETFDLGPALQRRGGRGSSIMSGNA